MSAVKFPVRAQNQAVKIVDLTAAALATLSTSKRPSKGYSPVEGKDIVARVEKNAKYLTPRATEIGAARAKLTNALQRAHNTLVLSGAASTLIGAITAGEIANLRLGAAIALESNFARQVYANEKGLEAASEVAAKRNAEAGYDVCAPRA
jgi:hypothetical protein